LEEELKEQEDKMEATNTEIEKEGSTSTSTPATTEKEAEQTTEQVAASGGGGGNDSSTMHSCGEQDYIYHDSASWKPIKENIYKKPINVENGDCPHYLCQKDYPSNRVIVFYNPKTHYEESIDFRETYRAFGTTLRDVVKESTFDGVGLFAISCCANQHLCSHTLELGYDDYPMFMIIKEGENHDDATKAHFSEDALTGLQSIDAVNAVYNILYPESQQQSGTNHEKSEIIISEAEEDEEKN